MTNTSLMRLPSLVCRPFPPLSSVQLAPWKRLARFSAFEASLDPADLSEARKWRDSVSDASLPKGTTVFARSSGPGGQHVNKSVPLPFRARLLSVLIDILRTETKAITTWPVAELTEILPKLMHPLLRSSKHYVKNKDSLSFHAQTGRDRNANAEENRSKLLQELQRMYSDVVPGDTGVEKKQKHAALSVSPPNASSGTLLLTSEQREVSPSCETQDEEAPELQETGPKGRLLKTSRPRLAVSNGNTAAALAGVYSVVSPSSCGLNSLVQISHEIAGSAGCNPLKTSTRDFVGTRPSGVVARHGARMVAPEASGV